MNPLLSAMQHATNTAHTENGALTNASTLDACLDFFNVGPVAKASPADAVKAFKVAYSTDREVALRVLQWVRDVRGGAGARQAFRDCFTWLMDYHANDAIAVLNKTALIGRWDDVLVALFSTHASVQQHAIKLIRDALNAQNGLCAKWMPRKGPIAGALRSQLSLSPKAYRKLIVELSTTVEQQMCAKEWDEINYSHVPSVAFSRYRKAFKRNDETRFAAFAEAAVKGEVKVNASAVFPHDVVKGLSGYSASFMGQVERNAVNAQWKSLPNYMPEGDTGIVVADVSGSMGFPVSGQSTAMDVCIALAMYMGERASGPFKDAFITFSSEPRLQVLSGDDIVGRYNQLQTAQWSMSTDLQKVFHLLLNTAVSNSIAQADMPKFITILSDMEFNACIGGGNNLDSIRAKYKMAGYEMPKVIFWNLRGRLGNNAATATDKDVGLISGYSPAILSSVFKCEDLMPVNLMLTAVMVERYDLELV